MLPNTRLQRTGQAPAAVPCTSGARVAEAEHCFVRGGTGPPLKRFSLGR